MPCNAMAHKTSLSVSVVAPDECDSAVSCISSVNFGTWVLHMSPWIWFHQENVKLLNFYLILLNPLKENKQK